MPCIAQADGLDPGISGQSVTLTTHHWERTTGCAVRRSVAIDARTAMRADRGAHLDAVQLGSRHQHAGTPRHTRQLGLTPRALSVMTRRMGLIPFVRTFVRFP